MEPTLAILPFGVTHESDSAAILPFVLQYEVDSDAMLQDLLLYGASYAVIVPLLKLQFLIRILE